MILLECESGEGEGEHGQIIYGGTMARRRGAVGMHIRVELDKATLKQLLAEMLPITIALDEAQGLDGSCVTIDPVRELQIGADESIRLITGGELRWMVGFLRVTTTVERLVLVIRPTVVGTGASSRLLFRPMIEEADLRYLPALLDRGLVGLVNGALAARSERLAWDVGRTLALRFVLPNVLTPLESAAADVEAAQLRVRDDALELTVTLTMHISRLDADRTRASSAA